MPRCFFEPGEACTRCHHRKKRCVKETQPPNTASKVLRSTEPPAKMQDGSSRLIPYVELPTYRQVLAERKRTSDIAIRRTHSEDIRSSSSSAPNFISPFTSNDRIRIGANAPTDVQSIEYGKYWGTIFATEADSFASKRQALREAFDDLMIISGGSRNKKKRT